jgi:hypothetical protein
VNRKALESNPFQDHHPDIDDFDQLSDPNGELRDFPGLYKIPSEATGKG